MAHPVAFGMRQHQSLGYLPCLRIDDATASTVAQSDGPNRFDYWLDDRLG